MYEYPPKTQNKRKLLAAQVIWTLKHDGDITDTTNGIKEMKTRLANRGVQTEGSALHLMLDALMEPEWGEVIYRDKVQKRTRGIVLLQQDEEMLPPDPFPEPVAEEPEPEPTVEEAAAPSGEPVSDDAAFDDIVSRFVSNTDVPEGSFEDATTAPVASDGLENFVPFEMPAAMLADGDPVQSLLDAQGLINAALIQVMAAAAGPDNDELLTRLGNAMTEVQRLHDKVRRLEGDLITANDTAKAHYNTMIGERKLRMQGDTNMQALIRELRKLGPDGFRAVERFMQETPSARR